MPDDYKFTCNKSPVLPLMFLEDTIKKKLHYLKFFIF